jgi:hypothetical protein
MRNKILKSYKSIIKSDDINPSDNTKNKNIEGDLDYSIDNKSIKEKDDEEIESIKILKDKRQ